MFQVDPSMAGGEAMCPMCHGLVAVPVDAFGPPVGGEPAVESIEEYDFRRSKSRGMFEGLDGGGKPSRRFDGLADDWTGDAGPEADALLPMACPHCGFGFQVDGSMAGQQAMCPTCHGVVTIPDEYGAAAGFSPPAPGFPPPNIPPPGQAHFGPLPPTTYAPPPSTPSAGFPPSVPMMPPNIPAPTQPMNPPVAPATTNPLPPWFASPATSPASASAPVAPLAPKPAQSSGVPLSALQPIGNQPATSQPPTSLTLPSSLSPSSSTSSSPPSLSKSDKSKPGIEALLPTESHSAASPASRPVPLSGIAVPNKSTAADAPSTPMSRAAKIDALLPEQADPDEEIMAERPIAVEEPPEVGFPPLLVDPDARTPFTDAHGMPMRRPSADERARNYRIRTMLLFGLGMLLLILAAVVLPELGFVINVGDKPK